MQTSGNQSVEIGEMENRIKECQLDLFADRTSSATMRANQLRLWFASMAYVLVCALRRIGLAHTQFADATCGTIRLKLLKLGALVRISVRRIKLAMASGCPWQDEFALAHLRLAMAAAGHETDSAQTSYSTAALPNYPRSQSPRWGEQLPNSTSRAFGLKSCGNIHCIAV